MFRKYEFFPYKNDFLPYKPNLRINPFFDGFNSLCYEHIEFTELKWKRVYHIFNNGSPLQTHYNSKKTEFIVFSSKNNSKISKHIAIRLCGYAIDFMFSVVRNFGVTLYKNLTFYYHVNKNSEANLDEFEGYS
jgi:hypothetical protein